MTTIARALNARLASLLATEHGAMADFLLALADFDRRRLWVELGYTSLFYYLHRELGLSKGAAFHRKVAAELLQRFPEVIEPMRDGRLCLSSVVELAKVLTNENRTEVLPRFFHRSAREAKEVSAELRPRADPPRREVVTAVVLPQVEVTRKVGFASEPTPTANGTANSTATLTAAPTGRPNGNSTLAPTPWPPARSARDDAEPLTADLRRLHVTVSRRFLEKLESARDGLSHARPGATAEQVLEAALDLLLDRQAKRRGLVEKPRARRAVKADGCGGAAASLAPSQVSSSIPAHIRRAVWTRDGGRCQWRLDSGAICGATVRLELDHVVPVARGGQSTVANLRLTCRFHNQLAARQTFGDGWMDQFASAEESSHRCFDP